MRRILGVLLVLSLGFVVACDSGDGAVGDADSLAAALASASAGDRVCLTAGVFQGAFEVPAGVELCGAGAGLTRIVGPAGSSALRVAPGGAVPTVVRDVTVEAHGAFGVFAIGPGDVEMINSDVDVPSDGAGIGAESLTSLSLTNVNVMGPVTEVNAGSMPLEPAIDNSATYGVVAVSVMTVEASSVEVSGFAYVGVLSVSSNLTWDGGGVFSNLGTGILVHGGTADLSNAAMLAALQGSRLIPAYNAVFAGSADISTNAVDVSGGGGYGILQAEATATHDGLTASDNANAALWIQNSGGFNLTNSTLRNNATAGIVALESSGINVDQVEIAETREMTRVIGSMPVMVGDGVHLLGSTTSVVLDGLGLTNNSRVGVLFDLEGSDFGGIDIRGASIDGTADQLGAIAQNGTVPPGWDTNVTRSALIDANDTAFGGALGTVGIVGPSDLPAVNAVLASGIAGIVGPSD